jgi:hypothetical protein
LLGNQVHGPWRPESGLRCNPATLLLDPYAKSCTTIRPAHRDRARALGSGFQLHLSKPLDNPVLIGSVARLTGREDHPGPEAGAAASGP